MLFCFVLFERRTFQIRKNKKPRLKKSHCNKLQKEIQKFIIRFCFYLNMKSEIQIIVSCFHVKMHFCFKFQKYSSFFVFHFHDGSEKPIT